MKTELNTLKDLVITIIKKQEKPETLTLLSLEAARLPDAIIAHTLVLSTDKQVQNYISSQQEQLIKEANLLYKCCLDMPRRIVHLQKLIEISDQLFELTGQDLQHPGTLAILQVLGR